MTKWESSTESLRECLSFHVTNIKKYGNCDGAIFGSDSLTEFLRLSLFDLIYIRCALAAWTMDIVYRVDRWLTQ